MNVDRLNDPRWIKATQQRAATIGRLDPLDATPDPGSYTFWPSAGFGEAWQISRQPAIDSALPAGLVVLCEFNEEPISIATDASAFLPLCEVTRESIGAMWMAILQRRRAR